VLLPEFMYRNMVERRLTASSTDLWKRIDAAKRIDEPAKRTMRTANLAASAHVLAFASALRGLGGRTSGETAWRFVRALNRGDDAVTPPHRLMTWAFLVRHYGAAWPESYDRLIEQAQRALGVENDAERRLAAERDEADGDEGARFKRFVNRTVEATVEVTLGEPVRLGEQLTPEILPAWTYAYEIAVDQWDLTQSNPDLVGALPSD
jgi:hypothetical protein